MNWVDVGRFLVVAGTIILVLGVFFILTDKLPLGKLPGDIQIGNGRFKVYIPIATSILISLVLTLVINFFSRR
ncbi:MAG TPA: DUF2905 domain-containing protein [Chitinispirillaceae bacterium]|jgi:hypothetical protein|nr:DUF2905 domain-containing protein [Chitinispirillaceae bacterium]